MTEYMNVGWMDALKVVSKNIWRCVMHIHKFCVDVRCAKILGSYSWSMPLEHLDVMVPDLQCFANLSSTYQVAVFQPILLFPSCSP
jgi:hypothetical protein